MSSVTVNVLDYGAQGNGKVDDTAAFERALAVLDKVGGGGLFLPSCGSSSTTATPTIYLIRPLRIRTNHILIELDQGVTLMGMAQARAWPLTTAIPSYGLGLDFVSSSVVNRSWRHVALIHGWNIQNLTIQGHGYDSVIHGQGSYWWNRFRQATYNPNVTTWNTRPHLLEFQYSQHLTFRNLRLLDAPYWNWHMFDCDHILVESMWIEAPDDSPNTDGWDPSSCRNVTIRNSWYRGGDDCVAIKSGYDCFGVWYNRPSQDITVHNVTCQGGGGGIAIGSEISGGLFNVQLTDLHFPGPVKKALTIKTGYSRGGWIRNVTISQVTISGTMSHPALHLDMVEYSPETCVFRNCRNPACPSNWTPPVPPRVSNIRISNVNGTQSSLHPSWKTGETFHFAALSSPQSDHDTATSLMTGIDLQNIWFQSTATWYCYGPIQGHIHSVVPGPPCFGSNHTTNTTMVPRTTPTTTTTLVVVTTALRTEDYLLSWIRYRFGFLSEVLLPYNLVLPATLLILVMVVALVLRRRNMARKVGTWARQTSQ